MNDIKLWRQNTSPFCSRGTWDDINNARKNKRRALGGIVNALQLPCGQELPGIEKEERKKNKNKSMVSQTGGISYTQAYPKPCGIPWHGRPWQYSENLSYRRHPKRRWGREREELRVFRDYDVLARDGDFDLILLKNWCARKNMLLMRLL